MTCQSQLKKKLINSFKKYIKNQLIPNSNKINNNNKKVCNKNSMKQIKYFKNIIIINKINRKKKQGIPIKK